MPPPVPETPYQSGSAGVAYKPTLAPMLHSFAIKRFRRHFKPAPAPYLPDTELVAPTPPTFYGDPTTRPGQIQQGPILGGPIQQQTEPEPSAPSAALEQIKDGTPYGAVLGVVCGAGTGLWWGKSKTAAGVGAAVGGLAGYFGGALGGALFGGLAGYIAAKVER